MMDLSDYSTGSSNDSSCGSSYSNNDYTPPYIPSDKKLSGKMYDFDVDKTEQKPKKSRGELCGYSYDERGKRIYDNL